MNTYAVTLTLPSGRKVVIAVHANSLDGVYEEVNWRYQPCRIIGPSAIQRVA